MDKTKFGDRMKSYEHQETGRRFIPLLPIIARLDGKTFSKFTKGLKRPYDKRLSDLMVETTRYLMQQTGAQVGYTQSDEITLIFYSDQFERKIYLDGRIQKMTSILASMATSYFVRHLDQAIPEKAGAMPMFDCRCWMMPNLIEASNVVLWRVQDAVRNSVSMTAHAHFSHTELHAQNQETMKKKLVEERGIVWEDYPPFFKWGTLIRRHTFTRRFTVEEIQNLPQQHQARKDPELTFERTQLEECAVCFNELNNRAGYLFSGEEISLNN